MRLQTVCCISCLDWSFYQLINHANWSIIGLWRCLRAQCPLCGVWIIKRSSLWMPIGCFLITPGVWGMEAELPAHFGIPESPTSVWLPSHWLYSTPPSHPGPPPTSTFPFFFIDSLLNPNLHYSRYSSWFPSRIMQNDKQISWRRSFIHSFVGYEKIYFFCTLTQRMRLNRLVINFSEE